MNGLPLWVRKALTDAVEASIAVIGTMTIVPTDWNDAKRQAAVISVAVLSAVIAAFRRAVLEGGVSWFRTWMGVE